MRYGIDYDDESDDEEEVEYPVSFNPFEPTRARALATLGKDVCDNHARQIEQVITPFDRLVMAYANGTLATQHGTPRVVETAEPQPNAMKPTVEAPRVERAPLYHSNMISYATATTTTTLVEIQTLIFNQQMLHDRLMELVTRNIQVPRVMMKRRLNNDSEDRPRKKQRFNEEPCEKAKQRCKLTLHNELQRIDTIENEFNQEFTELIQLLLNIIKNNQIIQYEEHNVVYEIDGDEPQIIKNDPRIYSNIYHRFRRWTARTKMKQNASQ